MEGVAAGHRYKSLQVRGTKQSNERGFLEPFQQLHLFRELFVVHPIKLIPFRAQGRLTQRRTWQRAAGLAWPPSLACSLPGVLRAS